MVPPQPAAQPQPVRALEPRPPARVPAVAPIDWGAPQGAKPSAQPLHALQPQQSAPVPAVALVDLGAPQGAQPSAQPLCAPEPQQSTLFPAVAPVNSDAPQGAQPFAEALCAPEPQQSTAVRAVAPVGSGAPQGGQPATQPPCAAPPQPSFQLPEQPKRLPGTATLNNLDYGPGDNHVEGFTQRWLDRDRFVGKASEMYTVHEMEAAEVWAERNGTTRKLVFQEWYPEDDEAWRWTRCLRISCFSFDKGGASLGSARMFASILGHANPCWMYLRKVRKAAVSRTTLHQYVAVRLACGLLAQLGGGGHIRGFGTGT